MANSVRIKARPLGAHGGVTAGKRGAASALVGWPAYPRRSENLCVAAPLHHRLVVGLGTAYCRGGLADDGVAAAARLVRCRMEGCCAANRMRTFLSRLPRYRFRHRQTEMG